MGYRTWGSLLATYSEGVPSNTPDYLAGGTEPPFCSSNARLYLNQRHDTLAGAVGLSLPEHMNPLMVALIMSIVAGSIIQHETGCQMVASITWFTQVPCQQMIV